MPSIKANMPNILMGNPVWRTINYLICSVIDTILCVFVTRTSPRTIAMFKHPKRQV